MICDRYEASFERKADLEAIRRGYGPGLIEYRNWLYGKVPDKDLKKKMRNYFSPDEIALLIDVLKSNPLLFARFFNNIPRDLDEISRAIESVDSK